MEKVTIVSREMKEDKNGRAYANIKVETPSMINGVYVPTKTSSFNAYEENYLGNKDFGFDVPDGASISAKFVSRTVEPYQIEDKTVTSATVLAFPLAGQSEIGELAIRRAFASKGHTLMSEESATEEVAVPENAVEA